MIHRFSPSTGLNHLLQVLFMPGLFILLVSCSAVRSEKAGYLNQKETIHKVLQQQVADWNNGNLQGYMQGYWQHDSLSFIGKSGITYGWQQTLDNYRKAYPDKTAMGTLTFSVKRTEVIGTENAYVTGKWHLTRAAGNLEGHFSLLWKKIDNRWVIVSDHSS